MPIRSLFATALLFALTLPAGAETIVAHTTTYASNPIRGTTPAELLRYMERHPIIDPDDGASFANLTHAHRIDIETGMSGGQCQVEDLTFTWQFVVTLPQAVEEAAMSSATRRLWSNLLATLKTHELGHRALFLDCAKGFPAAARRTGPQCTRLQRDVRAELERQYDACMLRQRAYDKADVPKVLSTDFFRAARLSQ